MIPKVDVYFYYKILQIIKNKLNDLEPEDKKRILHLQWNDEEKEKIVKRWKLLFHKRLKYLQQKRK